MRLDSSDGRMLCVSKSQRNVVLRWENQNLFLQRRHGHKKEAPPETILVGLRPDEDGFELLSWAINVAARPGDCVIVLHLGHNGASTDGIIGQVKREDGTATQLGALKDICNVKQVQLDLRFASSGSEELELIEEASSVLATMLVVSPTSGHVLRNSQKRGSLLARRAPAGCSVVVVKGYKVLYYNENVAKETKESNATLPQESHHINPTWRSKALGQPFGSLQRQFSRKLNPSPREAEECIRDTHTVTVSKIWPVQASESSPRAVLDGPGLSSESDGSSPSSSYSGLSHSLSRKALLSCVYSQQGDGDTVLREKSQNCLSLWRNGSIRRSSTFPPTSCLKRLSGPLPCASMQGPFKSYNNTLWAESADPDSSCMPSFLSDVQQAWRCFSYEELVLATNNFNPDNMVGKGGHAEVYKGSLCDGRLVAIKRLNRGDPDEHKEREFLTELGIVGHVSHLNTTPLIGFCVEEGLYLVFHFSLHGSLATLLQDVNTPVLDWALRYKVAVGTARGLHYLHTACQRRIIHRDIKASNILLDADFEPQIADFGLAKWLPEQWTQLSVFPVEGTFGYLAPEYFMHGIVNEKTDVFAFGVLLLELITGRQPIDSSQQSLVIWAKPLLRSSRIQELADPRLAGAYDPEEMERAVTVASLCVHHSATYRPEMRQVLQLLTEESQAFHSYSMPLCQSHDSICNDEYNSSNYLSDLNRHRQVALQF